MLNGTEGEEEGEGVDGIGREKDEQKDRTKSRARDVISEKAARNGKKSATRQRRRIIIATTLKSFPPPPRASRVIKLRGSPAWYLPLAYPFLLFLFVVNSFLALNLNPFFPFNFASTYLPCSMDLPPEEKEEEEEEEEQEEMVVAKPR